MSTSLPEPDFTTATGVLDEALGITELIVRSPSVLFWTMLKLAPAVLLRFGRMLPPVIVTAWAVLVIRMPRKVCVPATGLVAVTGPSALLNRTLMKDGLLAPVAYSPAVSMLTLVFAVKAFAV